MSRLFPTLPRAIRSFKGSVWRYVKPPRTSFDLATAPEWASPVSLDFETQTMTATKLGAASAYGCEMQPTPPDLFVDRIADDLQQMWRQLRRSLDQEARVVDADQQIGVRFAPSFSRDQVVIRADLKTWPAIEGVTVPVSRRTLESTW